MVFVEDTMYTCIRIDTPVGSNSLWGKSKYPFTSCNWTVMDVSVASPEMIKHSDSVFLLAGREYDYHNKEGNDARYISLFVLDRNGIVQDRVLIDKHTTDQGYPSFVKKKNKQYAMSYYVGSNTATKVRLLTFEINEAKQNVNSISHKQ